MAPASDIIVVGAGIVGCAVAYELARRGASVEIVDERPVGMGATQASAGVLAPYIEAREGSPLPRPHRPQPRSVRHVHLARRPPTAASRCRTGAPARSTSRSTRPTCATLELTAGDAREARRDGGAARCRRRPRRGAADRRRCDRRAADRDARLRRRRRSDACARGRGARARRASRSSRAACAASPRATARSVVETDRGSLTGDAVVLAAGSWSGADRDRRCQRTGAGAAGPRPAALARLDGHAAAPRDLEQPLLPRAVGRWDAAGRGDGGGGGLRRAGDGGRRARSARRGVRDRARTPGRRRSAARASGCGRRAATACRSSARRGACRT